MEEWGIETFFSISTTMAEHTPEIADRLFIWPNFIDSEIYHDYGCIKNIPIMFSGHITSLYPWRQEVYDVVTKRFPCLTYPHLGYEDHSSLMIHGVQYSQAMNASWFVPTCGTLAMEVVRKHFEIPGSKSCLVTQESNSLLAAGFVDMENCVFATTSDITGKLDHLFENRQELNRIIDAGYNLVQTKHTLKQRSQIYDWYILNKHIKSNQKIVQRNPFKALEIVDNADFKNAEYIEGHGINLNLLREGDAKLYEGKLDEAEAFYSKCLNLIYWMPEPKLKLAICNLSKGNSQRAYEYLLDPIESNLGKYEASKPDPVEWAYFIISVLCKGDLLRSAVRARQFPTLKHPELNRARWLVNFIQGNIELPISDPGLGAKHNLSVHKLKEQSFEAWIEYVRQMLNACGQYDISRKLEKVSQPEDKTFMSYLGSNSKNNPGGVMTNIQVNLISHLDAAFETIGIPRRKTGLPSASILDLLIRVGKWGKLNKLPLRLNL
jgi:tetratricopeptide (TPR) repeat protein